MTKLLRQVRRIGDRLAVRSRKFTYARPALPDIMPDPGLNIPETRVAHALTELQISFTTQFSILGGDILGGGRADFLLSDYRIDLEYNGPFHDVQRGNARDQLRNVGFQTLGYRIETLHEPDLYRLKPRLLEIIGRPVIGV